jgi:HK97 gp10 family phage protein
MIKGKLIGASKLNRKLAALPVVAKDEMRKAIAQSAREIADLAERLVPVNSGTLAASIGWTWGAPPGGSMVLAKGGVGDMVATVYAGDDEAFYARWVEFGTAKVAAQPFFYSAYRSLRKRIRRRIAAGSRRAARKVAAR